MRESQTKKIPFTLILGDKEKDNHEVSYRLHGETKTTTMSLEDFTKYLTQVIANKEF